MRLIVLFIVAITPLSNAQVFSLVESTNLPKGYYGTMDWGDYDQDNDLDVIITGFNSDASSCQTSICTNLGNGKFSLLSTPNIPGVRNSSAVWGDYDKDGDLDFALSGLTAAYKDVTKIFTNNGNGNFSENTMANLYGCFNSKLAWGDYNNDGLLDLLLTGDYNMFSVTKVYTNMGNHVFTELNMNFEGFTQAAIKWVDYDSDGDLDIYLSGLNGNTASKPVTLIYRNEGNDTFTKIVDHGIISGYSGSCSWADFDNDSDLDLLITGGDNLQTRLYINNNGKFTEKTTNLDNIGEGSSALWADFDNDGDLDVWLIGRRPPSTIVDVITDLYLNDGNGNFVKQIVGSADVIPGFAAGTASVVDYDNDGDLDLSIFGLRGGYPSVGLYRNNTFVKNSKPQAPSGLKYTRFPDKIIFSWSRGVDNTTPSKSLTYNIRVGTNKNSQDVVCSNSNLTTCFQSLNETNAGTDTFFVLNTRSKEALYWSVQSIDNSLAYSTFAPESEVKSTITNTEDRGKEELNLFTYGNKESFHVESDFFEFGLFELKLIDMNSTIFKSEMVETNGSHFKRIWNLEEYKSGIYIIEIASKFQIIRRKIMLP